MEARVSQKIKLLLGLIILSGVFIVPSSVYAYKINPRISITQLIKTIQNSISKLQQPFGEFNSQTSNPQIYAQTAGFGGAGSLVRYFQEIDGTPTTLLENVTCPSGWTEALNGYGPHYIGVLAYNTIQDGIVYGFNGFDDFFYPPGGPPTHEPSDPPPPPEPGGPQVPGGEPPGGPSTPSGDPPIPPTEPGEPYYPPEGGPYAPPDYGPPEPGGVPSEGPPNEGNLPAPPSNPGAYMVPRNYKKITKIQNLIFPVAHAQINTPGYTIDAVAIGSDSVCSQSWKSVVSSSEMYNNGLDSNIFRLYSHACYTSSVTGATTCNRCRVCVK